MRKRGKLKNGNAAAWRSLGVLFSPLPCFLLFRISDFGFPASAGRVCGFLPRIATMIITIDGPAGTGKSSVAQAVAERLGFGFLDTGAMYRAIGLGRPAARGGPEGRARVGVRRPPRPRRVRLVQAPAGRVAQRRAGRPPAPRRRRHPGRVLRRPGAGRSASCSSSEQQRIGREYPDLVTEGRDQGTVVFPRGPAQVLPRRHAAGAGPAAGGPAAGAAARSWTTRRSCNEIVARDGRDAARAVGPLAVPPDAEVIDTTRLTQQQVVQLIVGRAVEAGAEPAARRPPSRHGGRNERRRAIEQPRRRPRGGRHERRRTACSEGFDEPPPERTVPFQAAQSLCRVITSTLFDLKAYGAEHVPAHRRRAAAVQPPELPRPGPDRRPPPPAAQLHGQERVVRGQPRLHVADPLARRLPRPPGRQRRRRGEGGDQPAEGRPRPEHLPRGLAHRGPERSARSRAGPPWSSAAPRCRSCRWRSTARSKPGRAGRSYPTRTRSGYSTDRPMDLADLRPAEIVARIDRTLADDVRRVAEAGSGRGVGCVPARLKSHHG